MMLSEKQVLLKPDEQHELTGAEILQNAQQEDHLHPTEVGLSDAVDECPRSCTGHHETKQHRID